MGTLTSAPRAMPVKGDGRLKDGQWAVVFIRRIGAAKDGEMALDVPGGVRVAFAEWVGAVGDRNGQSQARSGTN